MNEEIYVITLEGCDDYTQFVMKLSPDEANSIQRLSSLSKLYSSYPCQPILTIEPKGEDNV